MWRVKQKKCGTFINLFYFLEFILVGAGIGRLFMDYWNFGENDRHVIRRMGKPLGKSNNLSRNNAEVRRFLLGCGGDTSVVPADILCEISLLDNISR